MEEQWQTSLELELSKNVETLDLGQAYEKAPISQLLKFRGETLEDAIAVWIRLDEYESPAQWARASLASWARANSQYGDNALEEFGQLVGVAYSTMRHYAAVFDRVDGLENDLQGSVSVLQGLTYTHYKVAHHALKDDKEFVEALIEAHDNSWSAGHLGNILEARKQVNGVEVHPEVMPPEARYPALSMINATDEQLTDMVKRLDEMDPKERSETLERVREFDTKTIADLAGVPYVEAEVDEAYEAAKSWDKMWRDLNGMIISIKARGGIAHLTDNWGAEQKETMRQNIARVREALQEWEQELTP